MKIPKVNASLTVRCVNSVSNRALGSIMGTIVSFDFDRSRRTKFNKGTSSSFKGTILFFTGVRYVRDLSTPSEEIPTQGEDPTRSRRKRKRA